MGACPDQGGTPRRTTHAKTRQSHSRFFPTGGELSPPRVAISTCARPRLPHWSPSIRPPRSLPCASPLSLPSVRSPTPPPIPRWQRTHRSASRRIMPATRPPVFSPRAPGVLPSALVCSQVTARVPGTFSTQWLARCGCTVQYVSANDIDSILSRLRVPFLVRARLFDCPVHARTRFSLSMHAFFSVPQHIMSPLLSIKRNVMSFHQETCGANLNPGGAALPQSRSKRVYERHSVG